MYIPYFYEGLISLDYFSEIKLSLDELRTKKSFNRNMDMSDICTWPFRGYF